MAINKGIPVINNFDLYAQKPLDSRIVVENEQELGELVNKGAIYDGMIFYRKDAQKFFQAQYLESGLTFTEFGGSGGNVSPILYLFDVNEGVPRTTITEQEKQNLDNKLYSQVIYSDNINSPSYYTPSKICYLSREIGFTQFIVNEDDSISSLGFYSLLIGEKNTNNEYPIGVQNIFNFPLEVGLSIPKITLTQAQTSNLILDEDITFTQEQYNTIIANSLIDIYITIGSNSVLTYRMNVRPTIDSNDNAIWVLVSNVAKSTKYLTQKTTDGLVFSCSDLEADEHPITQVTHRGSGSNLFWEMEFLESSNTHSTFYSMPAPQDVSVRYILTSSNGEAKWL